MRACVCVGTVREKIKLAHKVGFAHNTYLGAQKTTGLLTKLLGVLHPLQILGSAFLLPLQLLKTQANIYTHIRLIGSIRWLQFCADVHINLTVSFSPFLLKIANALLAGERAEHE